MLRAFATRQCEAPPRARPGHSWPRTPRPIGHRLALRIAVAVLAVVIQVGCADSPTEPSDPVPGLRGGVLATFDVSGERFRVWLADPAAIETVLLVRDGRSGATIPVGPLRRGSGPGAHNAPWSWHLDPADVRMAEVTIELCDGRPSYVEAHLDEFIATVGQYCPWGARLIAVDDRR